MMQMNNPLMQIGAMLACGKTPEQALRIIVQNNPQIRQVMQMMNGKTSKELEQMAHNMAKERGTTIENVARSLGVTIPSNR